MNQQLALMNQRNELMERRVNTMETALVKMHNSMFPAELIEPTSNVPKATVRSSIVCCLLRAYLLLSLVIMRSGLPITPTDHAMRLYACMRMVGQNTALHPESTIECTLANLKACHGTPDLRELNTLTNHTH